MQLLIPLTRGGEPLSRQIYYGLRKAILEGAPISGQKLPSTRALAEQLGVSRTAPFLESFRTKSMPAHAEIGMKILGAFLSIEDEDTFFFMRGFPDLASRQPMKAKFYESELWKSELEQLLMPMIEKYDVVLVEDNVGLIAWK